MDTKKRKLKNICSNCQALCCSYVMLEIDEPEDREDFEKIRWFVAHENISVAHYEDSWMLYIKNKCKFIDENHNCTIYDKRPQICREHQSEECDYFEDDDFEIHLQTIEDVDKFAEEFLMCASN